MASDVHEADVQEILAQHHTRYEVRPYYVVLDERPVDAPHTEQKVHAGFDVDLYGTVDKEVLPLYQSDAARTTVDYLEAAAKKIQTDVGKQCTIEVISYADSLILDTQQHCQPEVMLRIRISHTRGVAQPAGPAEEQALNAIREALHDLRVKEG
jgi:hypothetical protein